MRVFKKTFQDKINDFSNDILEEQSKQYYEIDNNTLEIIKGSEAIKLQITHWFDTWQGGRYFQVLYGDDSYKQIHKRESDVISNFNLDDFIDKLEKDLQYIIVVNRDNSEYKIEQSNNLEEILYIEISYYVKQTNISDTITLS